MLGIFVDVSGTQPFTDLGELTVGEQKRIPFYLKNTGNYMVRNITVRSTYPDTIVEGSPPYQLAPGQSSGMKLVWKPGERSLELKRKGEERTGVVHAEGMEVF